MLRHSCDPCGSCAGPQMKAPNERLNERPNERERTPQGGRFGFWVTRASKRERKAQLFEATNLVWKYRVKSPRVSAAVPSPASCIPPT
eukprot:4008161-Pyramimonas_sp.AAC.1